MWNAEQVLQGILSCGHEDLKRLMETEIDIPWAFDRAMENLQGKPDINEIYYEAFWDKVSELFGYLMRLRNCRTYLTFIRTVLPRICTSTKAFTKNTWILVRKSKIIWGLVFRSNNS